MPFTGKHIHIRGIWGPNKGAHLMMRAVMDAMPDNTFYLDHDINEDLRQHYGIQKISPEEDYPANVVIDASGYAYGDNWGLELAKIRLGHEIYYLKSIGVKVIMLPQAFGPFEKSEELKAEMTKIFLNADYVFPRDDISYNEVTKLVGELDHIKQFPDFTTLLEPPGKKQRLKDHVAVCPNKKILETYGKEGFRQYLQLLAEAIGYMMKQGKRVVIVIHETQADRAIADQLNKLLPHKIPVIEEWDPVTIKDHLARFEALIGSRFHALVGALSQNVPSIAIGWSHKYEMLLREYDCEEMLIDINAGVDSVISKLDILVGDGRSQLQQRISSASDKQKQKVRDMWQLLCNAKSHV